MRNRWRITAALLLILWQLNGHLAIAAVPETERLYLSGTGPKTAVAWDFMVDGGRRAGERTRIPVPSHWEQHGFGAYNYGQTKAPKINEKGYYGRRFTVPEGWKDRRVRLVFEGVMTDATVKVNGVRAGPTHQGAFYRFHYDVTKLVKFGGGADNLLEVEVAKASANADTDRAERHADYWVFGGIFRPVWLEASPPQAIEHVAIDARADGSLTADVTLLAARTATSLEGQLLTNDGKPVGAAFSVANPGGGAGRLRLATKLAAPALWTAETPNLYRLQLTLIEAGKPVHRMTQRFGFRTFELRPGQGLFLNGQRILLKGVNRHAFRPLTGRALDPEDSYEDVRLIKAMNMNTVRSSHYPPDEALLEAADELGLYVLDELSGWQHAHDTTVGRRLIRAMIERDVNHPSILFWDNGNEGGWNRELDREFALHDPQNRRVLHPWELHDDIDTKHYPTFLDLARRLAGKHLVMPTEVLHGLYDGGHGAGLEDYWNAILRSPVGAGAFLWSYADEGIARTDQGGRIDVVSSYAPDGILGPRLKKEGSFFTIRDLWSPVQVSAPRLDREFDGVLRVANHYDFTSLGEVAFRWRLLRFPGPDERGTNPRVTGSGTAPSPSIAPHASGTLNLQLPRNWRDSDALSLTATGKDGGELWTWTWPIEPNRMIQVPRRSSRRPTVTTADGSVRLAVGAVEASFDAATGTLRQLRRGAAVQQLANGPRLAFARPKNQAGMQWRALEPVLVQRFDRPQLLDAVEIDIASGPQDSWAAFKLELSPDGQQWRTVFDSSRRIPDDGKVYGFPPQPVAAFRISQPLGDRGVQLSLKSLRIGFNPERYPAALGGVRNVSSGSGRDPSTGSATAWLETTGGDLQRMRWTLHADGTLQLDYSYALEGDFLYHGITFDHPMDGLSTVRTLAEGPYRVWQNRLRGTGLGVHERSAGTDGQPALPEFEGYFAGLRWASLGAANGRWTVASSDPGTFLRIGTPLIGHGNTTVEFPAGDLSFLHAIPAVGSKFVTPANTGPASQPARASGTYEGTLYFR